MGEKPPNSIAHRDIARGRLETHQILPVVERSNMKTIFNKPGAPESRPNRQLSDRIPVSHPESAAMQVIRVVLTPC